MSLWAYNSVQIRELKLSPRHLQAVLLQITTLVIIGVAVGLKLTQDSE